ncbi:hypothetical protein K378_01413 [Streptomyces sp. Amel2xB2]|nr:hypothetical protein K378_01413 [Streptomyces sp. Amel2xB2]
MMRRPASVVAWLLLAVIALKAPGLLGAALNGTVSAGRWVLTAPGGTAVLVAALAVTLVWCAAVRPAPTRVRRWA